MSNPLRNPNIDYERGWFSVTVQVAHNKSVFGAIVGEECELNALGRAVHEAWLSHPAHTPGLFIDEFVVMPNHFHAAVKVEGVGLSFVLGKFKSYTNHLYLEMKNAGTCIDIGPRLWQASFYDNLISSHEELEKVRRYFRDNPKNWNHDRFGAVTTYCVGNAELLSGRLVAFVASETRPGAVAGAPREWRGGGNLVASAYCARGLVASGHCGGSNLVASAHCGGGNLVASGHCARGLGAPGHCARGDARPVISTFTSPEEREVRAKCLRARRAFVWVCPGGIWDPLPPTIAQACEEGWGFVCSPVPSRTGVNKQRAIWCNQYVIKQAASVWVGSIRPGGSLDTLLKAIKGKEVMR